MFVCPCLEDSARQSSVLLFCSKCFSVELFIIQEDFMRSLSRNTTHSQIGVGIVYIHAIGPCETK
jgi:hypothetical protein